MKSIQKNFALQLTLSVLCGVVLAVHRGAAGSGTAMAAVGSAAGLVVLLFSLAVSRIHQKRGWQPPQPGILAFGLLAAAGFFYLASAAAFLLEQDSSRLMRAVTALFALACGGATLARLPSRDRSREAAACALLPVFFHSYYLLMTYRSNADNPYLTQYGYEMMVLLLALLGVYAAAAGRFEQKRGLLLNLFCALGLCFLTQELLTAALHWDQVLAVQGITLGTIPMLAGCWMVLACGLLCPSAYEPGLAAQEK